MNSYILIFIGGGIGSVCRYASGLWLTNTIGGKLPLNTLLVNALGSLVIGLLWGLSNQTYFNDAAKAFFFIGILGGFTTFSAFSLDTIKLIENREFVLAATNILLNNILSIACCYAAYQLSR